MDYVKSAGLATAFAGIFGIFLLAKDVILRGAFGGVHYYALIVLVVLDLLVAVAAVGWSSVRIIATVAVVWNALLIVLELVNVLNAVRAVIDLANVVPMAEVQNSYAWFANYLFNPVAFTPPNPPGIPGIVLDCMIIFEVTAILFGWLGRSQLLKQFIKPSE